MRALTLALGICAIVFAEDHTPGPDSQPQPGVPKGTITKSVLAPGRFYPGTPHNYQVYVPAQYDASKPSPFMIFLDGSGFAGNNMRVPVVLDNLIARHEVPPLIGIFIDPGVLPVLSDQAQNRYNRIFEYDNLSDRYARFLIEELIPEVGKSYNLSKDPNDRGIGGSSTGAVGAFVAAWNRPDQFRRVLSFIGTYVDMKGADHFPALIRKTEPKPIRIFMQDGRNDHIVANQPWGTFYAGSWPINNQVMYEAFEFAGYDVKYVLGDEGHNGKHGAAIMPDVLRWLWRDYPKPIQIHEPAALGQPGWDPRGKVSSVMSADKPWEQIGGDYRVSSNLAADKSGNVYFSDPQANRIYRSDAEGKITVFRENAGGARALAFGPDGRLYTSQTRSRTIISYGPAGDPRPAASDVDAAAIAVNAQGQIYFTDPAHHRIGRTDGKRTLTAYQGRDLGTPAALAFSPDQAMLIVTDALGRFNWSFQIAADGTLADGEPFYRLEIPESAIGTGAGSVTVDALGQVYFATTLGIQICEANGRVATILNNPGIDPISSVIFAGRNLDWLYAAAGERLYRRPVKQTGVAPWTPIKPPKPPL